MNPLPDLFYLLDEETGAQQDATCFLLDGNTTLIQRAAHALGPDKPLHPEPNEVVIEVVGVSGADTVAPWVLLLY